MVVPLHRTSSELHKTPNPGVLADAKSCSSESQTRPLVLRICKEPTMNTTGSEIAERQFITKEFADTLAGKFPAPYLRLHDRVQSGLAGSAADLHGRSMGETAYLDRMIHCCREVSLAGLPRTDTGQDECYPLLFESTFDLAEAEPEWALECLAEKSGSGWSAPLARARVVQQRDRDS